MCISLAGDNNPLPGARGPPCTDAVHCWRLQIRCTVSAIFWCIALMCIALYCITVLSGGFLLLARVTLPPSLSSLSFASGGQLLYSSLFFLQFDDTYENTQWRKVTLPPLFFIICKPGTTTLNSIVSWQNITWQNISHSAALLFIAFFPKKLALESKSVYCLSSKSYLMFYES